MNCQPKFTSSRALDRWIGTTVVVLLLTWVAAPIAAQGVVGHLYDFESGVPIATADVVMTNAAGDTVGRVISDAEGRFVILVNEAGRYSLSVSRLGYVSQVTARIELENDTLRDLEMTVQPEALGLDGLVVSAQPIVKALSSLGFYARKGLGHGTFILPSETEKMQAFSASGLLRSVPGIMVRDGVVSSMRREIQGPNMKIGPCLMKVLVNGIDRGIELDEVVSRYQVSAIEVYNSLAKVPAQYIGVVSTGAMVTDPVTLETEIQRACGAILVWTLFG